MPAPTRSLLICSTPRSGSTLLAEGVRATGVAGRPEEYFQHLRTGLPRRPLDYLGGPVEPATLAIVGDGQHPADRAERYDHTRADGYEGYIRWAIAEGTTPNAVFAAKLMWGYLEPLAERLARYAGLPQGATPAEALHAAFPDVRYVRVSRADTVRQAVSLWRAIQTWTWRAEDREEEAGDPPVYSADGIAAVIRRLRADEACWDAYFADLGVEPLTLVYEDFVSAYGEAVHAVLDVLGVRDRRAGPRPPATSRQADGLNEEWVERFRATCRLPA